MIEFVKRFRWPLALGGIALFATIMLAFFVEPFKIGFNPFEFVLKIGVKLVYLAVAIMAMHFVVKKWFPTIYVYCYTKGDSQKSQFMVDWEAQSWNPKLTMSVATHIGIFASVCILLALAF